MQWNIWAVKPWSGDRDYIVASYYNRGHAIARLGGLRRAAWRAASEAEYRIERN
jgi:hypothetical protein